MAIQKTDKIWHNGRFINWDDATLHVMSHVVNYGSSLFEGVRCYSLPSGPAIFRAAGAHAASDRLVQDLPYRGRLTRARNWSARWSNWCSINGAWPCYIRPIVLRGYGEAGVNPFAVPSRSTSPISRGASTWAAPTKAWTSAFPPGTVWRPTRCRRMAKAGANYMNSQLIKMEAIVNGYVEGIALDVNGYVSEGSGENLFLVSKGTL